METHQCVRCYKVENVNSPEAVEELALKIKLSSGIALIAETPTDIVHGWLMANTKSGICEVHFYEPNDVIEAKKLNYVQSDVKHSPTKIEKIDVENHVKELTQ